MENTENKFEKSETPVDVFGGLAVNEESITRFLADRDRYDKSKHVCICGHAINKHNGYEEGHGICQTGRHICPCLKKDPVIFANDTRYFMRKTYGLGSKHALSTGLLALKRAKKTAQTARKRTRRGVCDEHTEDLFGVTA